LEPRLGCVQHGVNCSEPVTGRDDVAAFEEPLACGTPFLIRSGTNVSRSSLKISIGTVGNFERLVVRLDSDCMMLPEELASLLNVDTCDVLVADLDGLIRWVIPDDAERPRGGNCRNSPIPV